MAKKTLLTDGATFHKVKKGFITSGGVYRKIKKAFVTDGGVYRPCWGGSPAEMEISSTGAMTDYGLVKMGDGNTYRLLAVTGSGTVTFAEPANGEVWMCGGGTSGIRSDNGSYGGGGGAGAFTATGTVALSGGMTAVVGAGGATRTSKGINAGTLSSFAGLQTSVSFSGYGGDSGQNGGTGGGAASGAAGNGDGVSKYPFGDSSYFKCHCAGGGGGGLSRYDDGKTNIQGGAGGTNGGNGGRGTTTEAYTGSDAGGAGGTYGGGKGGAGRYSRNGGAATFYGSAGGGGGSNYNGSLGSGGAGYQGVIYIRIKAA